MFPSPSPPPPEPDPDQIEAEDGDAAAAAAADAETDAPQRDAFAPPDEPCECYCLHCNRVFMSDGIWFQRVINGRPGFEGCWMCPTPNCDGKGFTFDIFPTDPNHPANAGWVDDDDEDVELDEYDGEGFEPGETFDVPSVANEDQDWDPSETKYAEMDQVYGDAADDFEGEEWKFGLQPGERPPEPEWVAKARRRWEEEQKRYDAPDERPRVIDASQDPEWRAREEARRNGDGGEFTEDDIPF
jgi:hypothetical protein